MYSPSELSLAGQKLVTANKRRWSHAYNIGQHVLKTMSVSNEAIIQVLTEHDKATQMINKVYSYFFQSICECPLLPLTNDYFPEELWKDYYQIDRNKYHRAESKMLDNPGNPISLVYDNNRFLDEFLALRLTQNFQLYSTNRICKFEKMPLSMSIGTMNHILQDEDQKFKFDSYSKV